MKYRYKIRGHAPETIDRDYLNNFNSWDIIIDLCNAKGYNITLEDVEFVNIVPDEHPKVIYQTQENTHWGVLAPIGIMTLINMIINILMLTKII